MASWQAHVLPHGELEQLAPRLWQVKGSLPRGKLPRTMIVHRLASGGLLVHSVVALDEPRMAALEALGRPEVMVVPNGMHRLDAAVWKERYPAMRVAAPRASLEKVGEKVAVDGAAEDLLPPLGVVCHPVPGVKPSELCYELDVGDGKALVFTDMLFNLPDLDGFSGKVMKWLGSTGFFGMTRLGRMMLLKDAAAFQGWLTQQARRRDLRVISVAHGDPVTGDCGAALRGAAARLPATPREHAGR